MRIAANVAADQDQAAANVAARISPTAHAPAATPPPWNATAKTAAAKGG